MPVTIYTNGKYFIVKFSTRRKFIRSAYVIGDFTAYMKGAVELEFCGDEYCAFIELPPGEYKYKYEIDGRTVLDNGEIKNGYNILRLRDFESLPEKFEVNGKRIFRSIYEIFVDRFLCEKRSGEKLGADLIKISEKLECVRFLGFDTIYLTPIFSSKSYHRYDVENYFEVDDHLGGNRAFEEFLNKAHSLGIKVILDTPIHHTSSRHEFFVKAINNY